MTPFQMIPRKDLFLKYISIEKIYILHVKVHVELRSVLVFENTRIRPQHLWTEGVSVP